MQIQEAHRKSQITHRIQLASERVFQVAGFALLGWCMFSLLSVVVASAASLFLN
jgi:hypothetical protein